MRRCVADAGNGLRPRLRALTLALSWPGLDGDEHDPRWFVVRPDSVTRCTSCGQAFKLKVLPVGDVNVYPPQEELEAERDRIQAEIDAEERAAKAAGKAEGKEGRKADGHKGSEAGETRDKSAAGPKSKDARSTDAIAAPAKKGH